MKTRRCMFALLIILAVFAGNICAQNAAQVIYGDFLVRSGLTRLTDILTYANEWLLSSTSGLKFQVNAANLDVNPSAGWKVMIDGQEQFIDQLGVNHLNALPITINLIDSVEIISEPAFVNGYFSTRGLLHIHTKAIQNKIAVRAHNDIGNETGDPGAYAYTKYRTPNVDRLGPNYAFSGDAQIFGIKLRSGFSNQNHYSTDQNVLNRHIRYDSEDPRGQILSPFIQMNFEKKNLSAQFFYFQSTSAGKFGTSEWGRDFHYYKSFGNELPLQFAMGSFSYQFKYRLNSNYSFYHSLNSSKNRIYWQDAEADQPNPDVAERRDQYRFGINYKKTSQSLAIYFQLEKQKLRRYENFRDTKTITLQHLFEISPHLEQNISIRINPGVHSQLALNLKEKYQFSKTHCLEFQGYYMSNPSAVKNEFQQNSNFNSGGVVLLSEAKSDDTKNWDIRLSDHYNLNENLAFSLSVFYRGAKNEYFTHSNYSNQFFYGPRIIFDPFYINNDSLILKSGPTTAIAGISIGFSQKISPKLRHTFHGYYSSHLLQYNKDYTTEINKTAKFQANYNIDYQMEKSFSIIGHLRFISGSKWKDYSDMRRISSNTHQLPGKLLADLSLHKSIWKNRIWANVVIKNIFNQEERYHPLGARFNLRWYIQLGIALDS